MTGKKLLSIRYRVTETHCLTAGRGVGKTTNVYLCLIEKSGDLERLVGLKALDLRGDRSDLAGKELLLTVEEVGGEKEI